jgi:hypothetical protein
MKKCWVLTLTDNIVPHIVGVVLSEQEAKDWLKTNQFKHKGWHSQYQSASYTVTTIIGE